VADLARPDYRLRLRCSGQGEPAVVLDGMADGGQAAWEQAHVPDQVAAFTSVCTYQRLGQPGTPLTSRQIAEDLHALLGQAGFTGPAVVVGWLFGGLTARVYAAQYPADVAGLVLVDSPEPGVEARLRALLPPERPDESAALQAWRRNLTGGNQQRLASLGVDNDTSVAQAGAAGPFGAIPLVVVTTQESDYPPEVAAQFKPVWEEMQAKPTALSSNSKQIVIKQPWPQQPDVLVDAIRQVVTTARHKATAAESSARPVSATRVVLTITVDGPIGPLKLYCDTTSDRFTSDQANVSAAEVVEFYQSVCEHPQSL
jgi:pimeloyl-ACP methyl ester carboxylesterase